jgi:hypothetical protein
MRKRNKKNSLAINLNFIDFMTFPTRRDGVCFPRQPPCRDSGARRDVGPPCCRDDRPAFHPYPVPQRGNGGRGRGFAPRERDQMMNDRRNAAPVQNGRRQSMQDSSSSGHEYPSGVSQTSTPPKRSPPQQEPPRRSPPVRQTIPRSPPKQSPPPPKPKSPTPKVSSRPQTPPAKGKPPPSTNATYHILHCLEQEKLSVSSSSKPSSLFFFTESPLHGTRESAHSTPKITHRESHKSLFGTGPARSVHLRDLPVTFSQIWDRVELTERWDCHNQDDHGCLVIEPQELKIQVQ